MSLRTPAGRAVALMLSCAILVSNTSFAQSTEISTEYLMTLYAPLNAPQAIDESLVIYGVRQGGWVKGPKISGTLIGPGGDWMQVLPDGTARLDVRATIETDDGALIYISYNGVIRSTETSQSKQQQGEVLKADDLYFLVAPTMRTSSEKYAWLNHVQCIGKMTELKSGEGAYVKYDFFIAR
jgi:hypothetical protein